MRRELAAVMEPGFRAHAEGVNQSVGRNTNAFRGEAVQRIRLVLRPRHQSGEGQFHSLRGVALENVAVERIERHERLIELPRGTDLREQSALRRVRLDIVEMPEVRRIFQVAEGGYPVALSVLGDSVAGLDHMR